MHQSCPLSPRMERSGASEPPLARISFLVLVEEGNALFGGSTKGENVSSRIVGWVHAQLHKRSCCNLYPHTPSTCLR